MAYEVSKRSADAGDHKRVPTGYDPLHDDSSNVGGQDRRARIVPEAIGMLAAAAGLFATIVGVFLVV